MSKVLTDAQANRLALDYGVMYLALRRIAAYQSPEKLQRSSQKDWGLEADEAISMAYENVIQEAKSALKGLVKPASLAAKIEKNSAKQ